MRYFNWKLAIVLLLALAIIVGAVVGLNYIQTSGRDKEFLEQGRAAFDQGQWQEAAGLLGKYIAKNRQDQEALHEYAEAQLKIRPSKPANVQQAIGSFRDILRLDSGDRSAARQLVELYLQTRAIGEARLVARRFLEEGRRDAHVERLLAEALIYEREYAEAYEKLQMVVEYEPNQIAAYERLAAITEERPENYALPASVWLDRAVENNPESPSAYLARARFSLLHQENDSATQDLETALTKEFSGPEEHMAMALLYRALGQTDSVETQLDAVQTLQPDHLSMWIFRAGLALSSQDTEKMRQVAEDGLATLDEDKWGFYTLAAELYIRADAFDQAHACLDIVRNQENRSAEVAFLEGLLAIQQDHVQEAALKWQRAMSLGYRVPPPSIQRYLGFTPVSLKLLLASVLEQLGDTMSSRQLLESLAGDNRADIPVQLSLARQTARTGDWAQTKTHAQRVLETDPNNAEAILMKLEADVMLLARDSESVSPAQWQRIQERIDQFDGAAEEAALTPLLRFQIALSRDDLETAEDILEQMDPNDPVDQQKVTVAWVNLLFAQNKIDEIIVRLKAAVEEHDQSPELVRLLAYFLSEAGDVEAVEQVLTDARARMEKPLHRLKLGYLLSDLLTEWEEEKKKEVLLRELNRDYPGTIVVQRRLLQCKSVLEQPEEAQALVDKIQSLEGEEGWQWRYEQARLWFGLDQSSFQNKYSEAVSLLRENLRRNGNDQHSRKLLAAVYYKAGETSLALTTYRNALDREPYNLSIIIPAVKVLQDAKEFEEADALLKQVANRDLTDPDLDKLQVNNHLQQGQVASAATLMERVLKDDPNNIDITLTLATLKVDEEEFEVARAMIDKIRENTHDASATFRLESLEVRMLMKQGDTEQALKRCNDLVATHKDAESLKLRFNVNMSLGHEDAAKEDLDQAMAYSPDDANLWVRKSALCWSLQQEEEAVGAMKKALSVAPEDPNVVIQAINLFVATQEPGQVAAARALSEQVGRKHVDDYRFKIQKVRFMLLDGDAVSQVQAEALLEQYTIDHSKEAVVWLMLGDLLMGRQDWAKAQNVAIRGLTELKDNFDLLSLKARAEIEISPSFAVQTLEAMQEQAPEHVGVALDLAGAHIRAKRPDKAIEVLTKYKTLCTREPDVKMYEYTMLSALLEARQEAQASALLAQLKEKYPDDQRSVIVQVQHWIKAGDYDAVQREVLQWLEVNPEKTQPVEYAATVWLGLGQDEGFEVSATLLSAALEKQPESEPLLMMLAQTYHLQRRVDEAVQLYKRVLQVNSRNVVAMNNMAWIYGQDLNQVDKALEQAREGLVLAPQYTDLLDTYGTLCYRAGQYDEAIKSLKECLNRPSYKRAPSAAATMYTLAKSYQARGDKTNARLMFRQCLDRNRQMDGNGLTLVQYRDVDQQLVTLMGNL